MESALKGRYVEKIGDYTEAPRAKPNFSGQSIDSDGKSATSIGALRRE
jgi:hypothetical protein